MGRLLKDGKVSLGENSKVKRRVKEIVTITIKPRIEYLPLSRGHMPNNLGPYKWRGKCNPLAHETIDQSSSNRKEGETEREMLPYSTGKVMKRSYRCITNQKINSLPHYKPA